MPFFTDSSIRVLPLVTWLDMAAGMSPEYKVVLPMIQRGFVWKPAQIIELWDSLLQGMPIGTLMASEMDGHGASLALRGGHPDGASDAVDARSALGLVDGQQRTLAMLMGWTPFVPGAARHRLWIDFGDEPPAGHLLRLRVTTRNQPFGYRRDDPNGRLSMDDRRCARQAYEADKHLTDAMLEVARPHPAGARISLPLDFAGVVNAWRTLSPEVWKMDIHRQLESIEVLDCRAGHAGLKAVWPGLDDEARRRIDARIDQLADGLARLFKAEIPLLRVDPAFFSVDKADAIEPPLARLFKRIGSNATPLSNADYIYSVLKHLMPKVHGMVERLHGEGHVASLLSANDLVMSALRLAATGWEGESDRDNPSKEDFHRMIWPKSGDGSQRQFALTQLLGETGDQTLGRYFRIVQDNLAYRSEGDQGLPRHIFPYLERQLVQVLLRLAQVGYLTAPVSEASRADALRLTLWWMQWVMDKPKASRIAFKVMRDAEGHGNLGQRIAEAIVQEGAGLRVPPPEAIERLGLHDSSRKGIDQRLFGQSRFATPPEDHEEHRQIREFYRHWWRPWNYRHPMLLWLQRDYVHELPGDPMAGMEDDTPYDFDHILPHAHWGGWTGVSEGSRLLDFLSPGDKDAHHVIGNGIGNVRVWHASDNRSDGDASPRVKMGQLEHERAAWMRKSAISDRQDVLWEACSPVLLLTDGEELSGAIEADKKLWDRERAQAFQRAVEHRTFDLYQRLYQDAGFDRWLITSSADVAA
ncbi:MAG: DUF262 domain-containing protein [Halothiobacillaceae bacterium]|nr:DUF262 domain-containing protein [Halothiobacillaceae bacterium]